MHACVRARVWGQWGREEAKERLSRFSGAIGFIISDSKEKTVKPVGTEVPATPTLKGT